MLGLSCDVNPVTNKGPLTVAAVEEATKELTNIHTQTTLETEKMFVKLNSESLEMSQSCDEMLKHLKQKLVAHNARTEWESCETIEVLLTKTITPDVEKCRKFVKNLIRQSQKMSTKIEQEQHWMYIFLSFVY